MEIGGQMDRYILGVNMVTGLGVMNKDTDKRHTGWYEANETDRKIERLEKEKEWLMTTLSKETGCWGTFEEMQQALKERE